MARHEWSRSGALVALLAITVLGCGGGGGGGGPTDPPMPVPTFGSATFEVAGAGLDEQASYGPTNLVFCRTGAAAGWADLWIRLAEQQASNGDGGPHLDIDVCSLGDGGDFEPMNPSAAACGGDKTFDIFWHARDGGVFANSSMAPSCSLEITRNGTELSGVFRCRDLPEMGGARRLDRLDGDFRCTMT